MVDPRPREIVELDQAPDSIPSIRTHLIPEEPPTHPLDGVWGRIYAARFSGGTPTCPYCGNTAGIRQLKYNPKSTTPFRHKCPCSRQPFTYKTGTLMAGSDYGPAEWLMAFDWLFLRLNENGKLGREGVRPAKLKDLKAVLSHGGRPASNRAVKNIAIAVVKAWERGQLQTEKRTSKAGGTYWAWKVRSAHELALEIERLGNLGAST